MECCKAWALVTQAKLKVKQLIHQFRVAKAKLDSTEASLILRPPTFVALPFKVSSSFIPDSLTSLSLSLSHHAHDMIKFQALSYRVAYTRWHIKLSMPVLLHLQ